MANTGRMPERDEETRNRRKRSSQTELNPTPQQSLTKQEQFGEVWKERESMRLGRGVWAEEVECLRRGSEWRDSWRQDSRGGLYLPTYL